MNDELSQLIELEKEKVGNNRKYTWSEMGAFIGISGAAAKGRWSRWRDNQLTPSTLPIKIEGVFSDDYNLDPVQIWDAAILNQQRVFDIQERKAVGQKITISDLPCGVVILSDLHLGNPNTDYIIIKRDAELIRDTPGVYCGFNGDGVDNWIVAKLAHLQRNQIMTFDAEWALFFSWLDMIREKLLWVMSGNHENWTTQIAGVDRLADKMKGVKVLYDPNQILFDLIIGEIPWRIKTRHTWKGGSTFNDTHGIEVGWERGGNTYDIGIGSHTHRGTLCRPFYRDSQRLFAILTGTYKTYDDFGQRIGFAPPQDRGSGMMLFDENGNMDFYADLERGVRILRMLRNDT